ncbi:MAG: 6-phosphogluconolactonase [Acidobacteria bacterium]|nr:6-phosphogluconolactonase [Acidobacteriota bacterium]
MKSPRKSPGITDVNSKADSGPRGLHIFPDVKALSQAVARNLADRIKTTLTAQASFSLVLAGGSTPGVLYQLLASEYRDQIPWAQLHLFWGDERYVPPSDPRSNYRMARETLLGHVPVPQGNLHPMPTEFPEAEEAAAAYERLLRNHFPMPDAWPRFDLVLLGMGPDGHTASLFPNSQALEEQERWVAASRAPVEPVQRLTLTLPVLNHAAQVYFLVAGAEKSGALRQALAGKTDASDDWKRCPAAAVQPMQGAVTWWTDQAAAKLMEASVQGGRQSNGRQA